MNQGESMIHCHCEPLVRLLPELPPLLQAHWDESEATLFGPQVYALDTERYACWERLGMLHVVTARDSSGSLQGYAAFTLTDCPHRPGKRLAALDGLYLAPAARKGLAVLKLLRAAEAGLRERGADVVQYSSPASRPCDALYRRLGARHTESVWHKELR